MIFDDTKSCLNVRTLPYLFKPIPRIPMYASLRVFGFVRGQRVYADIGVGEARFFADVVTGALFSGTGKRAGSQHSIDVGALKPCTLSEAKAWVAGARNREKDSGLKVWAAQGIPGVIA